MPRKAKRKAAKPPTVSQRVKQDQTVKINIKNLLPPHMERSGDYIRPQRGMPTDKNLNMGNQTRLVGPSIQYAIRPPEFLPLPERFNSQGQPSYTREAPARVGRPDLITTETNPSDIVPSGASVRAMPSQPLVPTKIRTPAEVQTEYQRRARETLGMLSPAPMSPASPPVPAYLPQQDESEGAILAAVPAYPDERDAIAIQKAMARSESARKAWATRRAQNPLGTSAATSGVPNVPMSLSRPPKFEPDDEEDPFGP